MSLSYGEGGLHLSTSMEIKYAFLGGGDAVTPAWRESDFYGAASSASVAGEVGMHRATHLASDSDTVVITERGSRPSSFSSSAASTSSTPAANPSTPAAALSGGAEAAGSAPPAGASGGGEGQHQQQQQQQQQQQASELPAAYSKRLRSLTYVMMASSGSTHSHSKDHGSHDTVGGSAESEDADVV